MTVSRFISSTGFCRGRFCPETCLRPILAVPRHRRRRVPLPVPLPVVTTKKMTPFSAAPPLRRPVPVGLVPPAHPPPPPARGEVLFLFTWVIFSLVVLSISHYIFKKDIFV